MLVSLKNKNIVFVISIEIKTENEKVTLFILL